MTYLSRIGSFGLTVALSTTCLALLPSSANAAGVDPVPAASAQAWIKSQLVGGVLQSDGKTDYGASLDAATGLLALGDTTTSVAIRDALAPRIEDYVGKVTTSPASSEVNINETARTAWSVKALGGDPAAYGGTDPVKLDLVKRISDHVDANGRVFDDVAVGAVPPDTDKADVLGQAYAAAVLATAVDPTASAKAPLVTTFLRSQQCAAGFFTRTLAATGATCDSTVLKEASVEATATAVIALTPRIADPAIKIVVDKAVAWLVTTQQSNGRWNANGTPQGSAEATTVAAAGYAVSLAGRTGPANAAAIWLRGQELANAGTCSAYAAADLGAVASSTATYDAVATTPLASSSAVVVSQFRRATARALLVLKLAPGGPFGTDNQLTVPRFSKPGRAVTATVRGAARNVVCATAPALAPLRLNVGYDGSSTFAFRAGAGGASTASIVDPTGQVDTASVTVLAKKKLAFSFKSKRVRSAKVAVVKVRGLAPGENVKVQFRGVNKNRAVADANGDAKLRFIVTGKRGYVKVRVTGEYNNRNRVKNLIVVRR
jgi:hypothetical protein